jgi:hypothetical protein
LVVNAATCNASLFTTDAVGTRCQTAGGVDAFFDASQAIFKNNKPVSVASMSFEAICNQITKP